MADAHQPIKIAILAMGGEGGGVLADWIVDLGEANGHIAQTTSVPGVAQRTGATIYYVELFARATESSDAAALPPVLALMPLPGDVDVVLASELMEAGRAVQRGLVTPERTTLIASTHRVYAINEKIAMGDGRSDSAALLAHAQDAAQRFIGYDMAAAAHSDGSVISAVLLGALAGSGVLPFSRAQFEATITRGGVGVASSLRAFAAAFERVAAGDGAFLPPPHRGAKRGFRAACGEPAERSRLASRDAVCKTVGEGVNGWPAHIPPPSQPSPCEGEGARQRSLHPQVSDLLDKARTQFTDADTHAIVTEGLRRLIDYQDPAYAALYLQRLAAIQSIEQQRDATATQLTAETARHLALWMSYEDTIRVADLKTRGSRFERVRDEVQARDDQLISINEYLHPRLQEIADTLPVGLGRWLLQSKTPRALVEKLASKGRVLQTSSLRGHLMLSAIAGLRRWRRGTLRFATEQQRIEAWLADIAQAAHSDLALATEIARCQRLVKGYGDTHERGWRNFSRLCQLWQRQPGAVTPADLATLRSAALADEHGHALQAALLRWVPTP